MLGGGVKIYDNGFRPISFEQPFERPDTHIGNVSVLIEYGSFVGAHSIILKGATIETKCMIGEGSVVVKDVPDGEVWAGNLAKK